MSTKYKKSEEVPSDVICARLEQLGRAVIKGDNFAFTMSVPAEVDYDADFVLYEAARRIKMLTAAIDNGVLEEGNG